MNRVNEILNDPEYRACIEKIDTLEAYRLFCKHGMEHSLQVARIAFMLNMQDSLGYEKELIYTAALLHDIGRADATDSREHAESSVEASLKFLNRYSYSPEEINMITDAIRSHSKGADQNDGVHFPFNDLPFRADKLSRACGLCPVQNKCHWPEKLKNKELTL